MQLLRTRTSETSDQPQFSLAALLEFPAVCGILSALSRGLNPVCDCCLMGMALALGARQGWLALMMLMAASLTADFPAHSHHADFSLLGQALVFLLAGLLCIWYRARSSFIHRLRGRVQRPT